MMEFTVRAMFQDRKVLNYNRDTLGSAIACYDDLRKSNKVRKVEVLVTLTKWEREHETNVG